MVITVSYLSIDGHVFSRPYKLLFIGAFFILFSFTYKFMLNIMLSQPPETLDITPIIDMSSAALGGNLIAASFIIKAQKKHSATKKNICAKIEFNKNQLKQAHEVLQQLLNDADNRSDKLLPGILKEIRSIENVISELEDQIQDLGLL